MRKKVFIYGNLVCSRRSLDTMRIYNYLIKNSYEIVKDPKKADIIVLNTCSYSNIVANNSLKKVEEFKYLNKELIVVGCLPEIKKEELDKIFKGKKIGTKNLEKLDDVFQPRNTKFDEVDDTNVLWKNLNERKLGRYLANLTEKVGDTFAKNANGAYSLALEKIHGKNSKEYTANILEKQTYYVRISRGCFGNCSYCAIKQAIGPLKSKPIEECIKEFKKGVDLGYKIFRFGADDIGAYGLDKKSSFIELLTEIFNIPGNYAIEIETISPRWIIKYFDEFESFLKTKRISMIFSAIQSANDRILNLMNRYYAKDELIDTFTKLRQYKDIRIGTELIAGFPTETMDEFQESLDFIKEMKFNRGFVNPFSLIAGTLAVDIMPYVSEEEISRRTLFAKDYLDKKGGYKVLHYKKQKRNPIVLEFYKK